MDAALYRSKVMHMRLFPRRYRFVYRVASLLLNLSRLDELDARLKLFSVNRFNLFSFQEKDHGPCDGSDLRSWAVGLLARHRVSLDGGKVELLCFPRILGFVFNPLSLWFCYHRDGQLRAVIYEVRNTFGEKHHYLVKAPGGGTLQEGSWHAVDKVFHVSPFLGMNMQYRFLIQAPAEKMRVVIDEYERDEQGEMNRMLVATLAGERVTMSDRALLGRFLSMPLMTIKVVAMIHWQAAKLWLRGVQFHRKPEPPMHEVTETCRTNNH
ncbi:MAG: DUF1365 domain-containing protein [Gammaproteobacteria bacterium]|nr:DUF1365 domain-containing protein [Gammaproteobacteria bacterium]